MSFSVLFTENPEVELTEMSVVLGESLPLGKVHPWCSEIQRSNTFHIGFAHLK